MSTASEVTRALRADITASTAGKKFPTVRDLMQRFGVSQWVVSQAMATLRDEGLIESHVGRGTFTTSSSELKKILLVCGIHVENGEYSPYYAHHIQLAREHMISLGYSCEVAWLDSSAENVVAPYCTEDSMDKYAGFYFLGCSAKHKLVKHVAIGDRIHVGGTYDIENNHINNEIWIRIMTMGLTQLAEAGQSKAMTMLEPGRCIYLQKIADEVGIEISTCEIEAQPSLADIKANSYYRMLELIDSGKFIPGMFIMDDIMAQGATRAILERFGPADRSDLDVVVYSSIRDVVPLGLPITYVLSDTEELAHHRTNLLHARISSSEVQEMPFEKLLQVQKNITGTIEPKSPVMESV